VSKFQLPTSKAGEAFPDTIKSPVSVRFDGVPPGTDLARALFQSLQGEINSFYLRCAQNYALSPSPGMRNFSAGLDWSMQYINNQGMETIRISVSRDRIEKLQQETRKSREWDWVLIEADIGGMENTKAVVAAYANPLKPDKSNGYPGFGISTPGNRSSKPFVFFAGTGQAKSTKEQPGATRQYISILVDLRPFQPGGSVTLDLYGYVQAYTKDDTVPSGSVLMAQAILRRDGYLWTKQVNGITFGEGEVSNGFVIKPRNGYTKAQVLEYHPELAGFPWISQFESPPQAGGFFRNWQPPYRYIQDPTTVPGYDPNALFQPIVWITYPASWAKGQSNLEPTALMAGLPGGSYQEDKQYYAPGVLKSEMYTGWRSRKSGDWVFVGDVDWIFDDYIDHSVVGPWIPGASPSVSGYGEYQFDIGNLGFFYKPVFGKKTYYEDKSGPMSYAFFHDEEKPNAWSHQTNTGANPLEGFRWEWDAKYPERPKAKDLGTMTIKGVVVEPGDFLSHYNYPKIGTLEISIGGSVKWTPA